VDTETARKRLEELLADLDQAVSTLQGENPTDSLESLPIYDHDPADAATNLSDADRASALLEAAGRQRTEVVDALERIEAGAYGRCLDCGNPVPDGRLEARPEAARCVKCQSKLEARR
jgi:DnaK suppressor protein